MKLRDSGVNFFEQHFISPFEVLIQLGIFVPIDIRVNLSRVHKTRFLTTVSWNSQTPVLLNNAFVGTDFVEMYGGCTGFKTIICASAICHGKFVNV